MKFPKKPRIPMNEAAGENEPVAESPNMERGERIMRTEPEYQQPLPKRQMKGEQKPAGRNNYKGKPWGHC